MAYSTIRKKKPDPNKLSSLKNELDKVFSHYIKLRDANDQGTVTCFVTGEKVFWSDLNCEAMHYINRGNMATRWDEINVHAGTMQTNRFDNDHLVKYNNALYSRYPSKVVDDMLRRGRSLMKWTVPELQEKIFHYTERVKELRRQKGL